MAIKEKDFIEVEYTGTIKADNAIFDTTDENTAKDNNIHDDSAIYGPKVICVGEKTIIKGIDEFLIGKEPGEYELEIKPEDAFGKKDAKLLKIIPTKSFTSHDIKPFPGLQVNVDGMIGLIKTVSGGRCIVDFNHPLAGHELHYKIKVKKIVEDDNEKVKACFRIMMGGGDANFEMKDGVVELKVSKKFPDEAGEAISEKIKSLVPAVKEVKFVKAD